MWSLFVQDLVHNKLGISNESRTYNVSASLQKQLLKIEQRYLQAFNNAGVRSTDAVREYRGNALSQGNVVEDFINSDALLDAGESFDAGDTFYDYSTPFEKQVDD